MYALLIVIHVIACIGLILVILLQAGRGGGLSETFGSSVTQSFFGTSAAKFLQKATAACAIVFLLTCLSLAVLSTRRSRSLMQRERLKGMLEDIAGQEEPGADVTSEELTEAEKPTAADEPAVSETPFVTEGTVEEAEDAMPAETESQ